MAADETGKHHFALEIDNLSVGTNQRLNPVAIADIGNLLTRYGNRFGSGALLIHRVNCAINKHGVSYLCCSDAWQDYGHGREEAVSQGLNLHAWNSFMDKLEPF
ncbi:hypothetical protein [Ruegeria sp. AU67]|uniref:hypothetical protein n=1 Tax=Ruegeria sp. AU67 TaxID=2108530 RepID=UPI00135ADD0E|nr:hypothetical protein [Ruegeria sp. AU67]